ncbi:nucleoside-diphosphate kinase [Myxococcus vastator]|uniref:nucleoside-diphosphate kinase n=1 Tax=Myxococcus vastator TaxID=2709664 RepID=UPI0013D154B1|nr:nucleoside-diphosphate kinase [Myxococcus vastator]
MRNLASVSGLVDDFATRPGSEAFVFTFFDPYALGLGLAEEALAYLQREGFHVVDRRFIQYTQSTIEAVYSPNRPIAVDKTWAVPSEIYLLEPSCALLLHTPGRSACAAFKALKGSADPRKRSPHHLRSRLQAPTRALSLMHSSDDTRATLEEAATAFDPRELRLLLASQGQPTRRATSPGQQLPEALVGRAWRPSPMEFLMHLRLRLAEEVELIAPFPEALVGPWREASSQLAALRAEHDASRELYLRGVAHEAARVAEVVRAGLSHPRRPGMFDYRVEPALIATVLELLHQPALYRETDLTRLIGPLGALVRNAYERALLRSALQEFE